MKQAPHPIVGKLGTALLGKFPVAQLYRTPPWALWWGQLQQTGRYAGGMKARTAVGPALSRKDI
jgi:hypothetical protein